MPFVVAQEGVEVALHRGSELGQPWHFRQSPAFIGSHRGAEDAGRPRVGRADKAVGVEHDHASREVVQNRLKVGAAGVHLSHAFFYRLPGIRELLGHECKRPRQSTQFVLTLQCGFGAEVSGGDLAHPFGQHQQRPSQLVTQQNR
ncbi:hypothetical protein D3C71_1276460 [compost metagenome]